MRSLSLSFICVWLLSLSSAYGESFEPAEFPSLISALKITSPLEFCGEQVPTEKQEIRERFEKEFLLSLGDRPQVILWLKRSHRYLPDIDKALKKAGMPGDLKYVAIAESALRPHAGSKRGAIGFWQFMADTGRRYGLVINEYIDERRNHLTSTRAAIKYFRELYKKFGSWTLAAAAYNMGEEGLRAEILEQNSDDYYQLYLSLETQRFIFRILSVKLLVSDPERYGFKLTEKDYYPPLIFDQIQVNCSKEIPIRIIARAAKTYFKVIKDLNPEIRGYHLTIGSHKILVPKGASVGFHARYQRYVKKFLASQKERIYIVKKGDNLSSIADRFNVPLAALIIWNRIDMKRPIHQGDRLIIYGKEMTHEPE
ncbi:MAG: transglycosylase SLT domain-containing protein [Deltaproteobacteria bacterium]|nr:transglycosylase SLT domain-containing protein [Deltaproteobacteria bacterium]